MVRNRKENFPRLREMRTTDQDARTQVRERRAMWYGPVGPLEQALLLQADTMVRGRL
jgi:hypothetical protein